MTPTLDQLRALVKIVESGSLSKAADVLDMQRSNLSRTLAQLESTLGVTLLDRNTRSQSLTEMGRAVHERAVAIVAAVDDTVQLAQRIHGEPSGLLRLTCSVEFGMAAVGAWVESYLQRYPRVRVGTEYATREIDMVHEGFDLGIRAGPLPPSRLRARQLGVFRYGLYASPTYLAQHSPPEVPADLAHHDLVQFTGDGGTSGWSLVCAGTRETVRVGGQARLRVNAGSAVRSALLSGLGVGLLPEMVAKEPEKNRQLVRVLPQWDPPAVPVHAVYPGTRYLTPKVRAFVDLAAEQFPG